MATMLSSAKSIRGAAVTASAPRRAACTTAARLQVSAHCQGACAS